MIKMGRITYTNVLPVYYHFNVGKFADQIEMIPQIPAQLNRDMKAGLIDLGPISSFAYAENRGEYKALPKLSVSCRGEVGSIFLFSKKPIRQLKNASIALTSSSATSVALLKILLEYFHQLYVSYETMDPQLDHMLSKHDAALLIGDDALHALLEGHGYPYVYDLGQEWYNLTQRTMTFAVWAVRKETVNDYPQLLQEVYEEFLISKQQGIDKRDEIIADLSQSFGGQPSFWEHYFKGLCYDFTQEQVEDLEYFYGIAYQMGLLREARKVDLWEPEDAVYL